SDEGDPKTTEKGFREARHTQMSATQLAWLEETLATLADIDHVFVFLNHPRWIQDSYPGTNWDDVHRLPVKAGNVTSVFAGHIHRMLHDGIKDGIEYLTLATTGGDFRHEIPRAGWLHHFDVVTVRKDRISLAAVPVGAVIDPREMTPERLREVDL